MSVELPHIEDKIYGLFAEFLQEDWMTDEELKETGKSSMKSSFVFAIAIICPPI